MANLASIDEKINSDTDFQATLADMSDEDKEATIAEKRTELIDAELAKEAELAANYKVRAEKAEALAKQLKTQPVKKEEPETPKTKRYSLEEIDDITALSSVPREDRSEILEYAERKGITPSEALGSPLIKTFLKVQAEERTTANATIIGKGGKPISKITGETLLEHAERTNEIPDTDEGMRALVQARIARKIAETKS